MQVPISIAAMTAREMSRCGFRASPPICIACSKPCRANTTPAGSAAKTPSRRRARNRRGGEVRRMEGRSTATRRW